MDDESEAERLKSVLPQPLQGYGEVLTDEDIKSYSLYDFDSFDAGIRGRE